MADKKISVTLTKSPIGSKPAHRKIVKALGLGKMHKTVILDDTPAARGSVEKISHLVTVEEI